MGRYVLDYSYEVDGDAYLGRDVVDTRYGNGQLAQLGRPNKGDRLTVLVDPNDATRSVLALGLGAGLERP